MKRVLRIIAKTGSHEDEEIEIILKLNQKVFHNPSPFRDDVKKEDIEKKFEEYKDRLFKLLLDAGFNVVHIKIK